MRHEVQQDLSDSAYDFQRSVWPSIQKMLGGGRIEPVEAVVHEGFNKELDTLAGIDVWHIVDSLGIRGIASRVQWGNKSWNTFTIRLSRPKGGPTEYEKRLLAIKNRNRGFLLPEVTVQAYMTNPRRQGYVLNAGVINTIDLFTAVQRLYEESKPERHCWGMRKTEDGEWLIWVSWSFLSELGLRVGVLKDDAKAA